MLKLLISNDDGYQSQGINILAQHLASLGHQVTIVAPAGERSAQSHSMSFYHAVQVNEISPNIFAVHGTPADSVAIGLNAILKDNPPDFVIAGTNHGLNVGIDVNYSGTVGAATEAALMGYKAIAISADTNPVSHNPEQLTKLLNQAAKCLSELLPSIQQLNWPSLQVLNINVPCNSKGIRVAVCEGESLYEPGIEEIVPKRYQGTRLYYLGGIKRYQPNDMSQDVSLVCSGYSTISFLEAKQSSDGFEPLLTPLEKTYENHP